MDHGQRQPRTRRDFLSHVTLVGAAAALGLRSKRVAAEPPPETTRIRLHEAPITCFAPLYVAEALLKAEGFTEVQYLKIPLAEGPTHALAAGMIDICKRLASSSPIPKRLSAPGPIGGSSMSSGSS